MSRPKTALESQELLYDRLLITLPYEVKAQLVSVTQTLDSLRITKWPRRDMRKAILEISNAFIALELTSDEDDPTEIGTCARLLAAKAIRLLLESEFK